MFSRRPKKEELRRAVDEDLAPIVEVVGAGAPRWKPYMESRYVTTVLRYRGSHEGYRRMFLATRIVQVTAALIVPVLAARNVTSPNWVLAWIIVIVGLIGAAATAVEQVWRPGARWRLSRDAHADLLAAGWRLERGLRAKADVEPAATRAEGASVGRASPEVEKLLDDFAIEAEDIIRRYEDDYLTTVAVLSTNPGTPPPTGEGAATTGAGR